MDDKDRQIIRALQRSGRMTNQDLALEVNLSPSPCLRRVRILEERGVINGYSADVDCAAYGLPVTVFVRITLKGHTASIVDQFEQTIGRLDQVQECYVMTGTCDYLLRVLVSDFRDYECFVRRHLHSLGTLSSIESSFVYGVVKRTNVYPS